jgi:hypothetical protein
MAVVILLLGGLLFSGFTHVAVIRRAGVNSSLEPRNRPLLSGCH